MPSSASAAFGIGTYAATRMNSSEMQQAADKVQSAGSVWVREELNWNNIEPSNDNWNFGATDEAVDKLRGRGQRVLGLLVYSADWASTCSSCNSATKYQPKENDWYDFVQTVARRYRGKIDTFEIWNEPNIDRFWKPSPNGAAYAATLQTAVRAIRSVNPSAHIISGGTSGVDVDFLESVASAGGLNDVDGIAVHPYRDNISPEEVRFSPDHFLNELRKVVAFIHRQGKKQRLWVTEFGWTSNQLSDSQQANWLIRASVLARTIPELENIIWYDLRNDAGGDANENNYGLVRRDFSEKQAMSAFRAMSNRLEGTRFVDRIDVLNHKMLESFDGFSGWTLQADGTDAAIAHSDNGRVGKGLEFYYKFKNNGNNYVIFRKPMKIEGSPKAVGVWIRGNDSKSVWRMRITDASGETFQGQLAPVSVWDWNYYYMGLGNLGSMSHWGGNNNGAIDYPITFDSLVLDDYVDSDTGEGQMGFDSITAVADMDDLYVYKFTGDGRDTYAIWRANAAGPMTLSAGGTFAKVFDRLGNTPSVIADPAGIYRLTVYEDPMFLQPQ